jgi:hypothetical protein
MLSPMIPSATSRVRVTLHLPQTFDPPAAALQSTVKRRRIPGQRASGASIPVTQNAAGGSARHKYFVGMRRRVDFQEAPCSQQHQAQLRPHAHARMMLVTSRSGLLHRWRGACRWQVAPIAVRVGRTGFLEQLDDRQRFLHQYHGKLQRSAAHSSSSPSL